MSSRYSYDIIRSEVILFTGAGASCPLGFEALGGLLKLVIDEIRKDDRWRRISFALGLFKADSLKLALNLEEFLERLDALAAMRDFEKEYKTTWFSAQSDSEEKKSEQGAFFTSQFKSDLEAALELRKRILITIRDHFTRSSDLMEKAVDLYQPLFELLRKNSGTTAIPVFTTNYDLALEHFTDRARSYGYGMIDGFDREVHATNLPWDPDVYHSFSLSTPGTKPVTLILFKLHGSVFWQKNGQRVIFNSQPTAEEIEYVLLYPMQTKTIVEDPFLTCYNYFEECLRNAKLMIAIGYSFGDDYLNQVIARCQLANPELKIMVFNPGFKDHPERRGKFDRQIGISEANHVYYDYFEIGKQGRELLRKVEREVLDLRGAKTVYQDELDFAELDKSGRWAQQYNEYIAEWSEGDELEPVKLYLQSSSALSNVIDAIYQIEFTIQLVFPSAEPDDWCAGVWLYQTPEPTSLKYWLYASPKGILVRKPRQYEIEEVTDGVVIRANTPHALKVKMEYGWVYYFVDGEPVYRNYESEFKVQIIAIAAFGSGKPFEARVSDLKIKWRIR